MTSDIPSAPLIERGHELQALAAAVHGLPEGAGAVVVVEAAAGLGKTALLDHGAALARASGALVRRAAPGPCESHFGLGVVRALLEAPLRASGGAGRSRLLKGAAAPAGELLLNGTGPAGDSTLLAHSVLWLAAGLAEQRPLALFVDDAQWADRSSLEVLAYLARRIEDLPLLLVIGARAEDPDAASDLLTLLGAARRATVLQPQPLTPAGAATLLRSFAPEASTAMCLDCHRAVDGNPWLLGELGRRLAAEGAEAAGSEIVRRRVAELCQRDRAVAEALAVVGEDAPPHLLARVAGIALSELGPARDALIAAGLLRDDGRRLAHGLIGVAIEADLPRKRRERLHREAASALTAGGADADLAAGHLLRSPPQSDPAASELLRRASAEAIGRGEPRAAAAYLERALAEGAPGDDRAGMLTQLSTVAFDAGLPGARPRLREALREVRDRAGRVDVLTRLAALNLLDADDAGLTRLFDRELAGETDPDIRLAVEAAALDALMVLPDRHAERARRVAAIDLGRSNDPLLTRVVLAHRAWLGVERGTPRAAVCAALAVRALDGGLLLEQAHRRSAYVISARTLVMTDHREAADAIQALRAHAVERGSVRLRMAAERYAAELALRTGRIAQAEQHARLALELVPGEVNAFTGGAVEVLVGALAERGAFEEAHAVLREYRLDRASPWELAIRHARARLSLAEGDHRRAYAEAVEAGALRREQGRTNPTLAPWRTTAALALARLGRRDEAAAVAHADLRLAERFGAPQPIAAALHACAVAERDPETRIALCRRALAIAPDTLTTLAARVELGAALAQLRRREEARTALAPALAEADAAGAVLLARRARQELVAAGLRPRRAALEGPAALTPRQREICQLVGAGKSNREIAQELYLSIKTVETHLAAGFRKLGVDSRTRVALKLAAA